MTDYQNLRIEAELYRELIAFVIEWNMFRFILDSNEDVFKIAEKELIAFGQTAILFTEDGVSNVTILQKTQT